jgi:chromosome segregation ATPase
MTLLGKILAILNVLAALAFATLLVLDYGKRQQWSTNVFLTDVQLDGLPLTFEKIDPSVPTGRYPSQFLDEATLKVVFAGAGEPVNSLEDELKKLQSKLPGSIEAAVDDVISKIPNDEKSKQQAVYNLLFPLARNGPQVDALKRRLDTAGQALDGLVKEAVKRHLLNEVLDPLQQLTPADAADDLTPKIAELDDKQNFKVTLEKLDEFLVDRLQKVAETKRRQNVSDLIFLITHLMKPRPDGAQPSELLDERGPQRAQVVLGLIQYNVSTGDYARALDRITQRVVTAIIADRDGIVGGIPGFVVKYDEQVGRLRRLTEDVNDVKQRLDDLKEERKKVELDLAERKAHHDAIVKKIMDSRAETLKLARQLQHMQQQLFVAQREMATAAEDNNRLLNQIRELEGSKKGTQQP